jgi:DNA-binding NarL/FixJ family response regulator
MIVDRFIAERRGIRGLLDGTRYQVVAETSDAKLALRLAVSEAPDIAIMDYNLIETGGLEIARSLMRARPSLQILIFSLPLADCTIARTLSAGIRGYVSKADPVIDFIRALDALSVGRRYCSGSAPESLLNRVLAGKKVGPFGILSKREAQVVQLIAEGRLMREIAAHLGISRKTIESHRNKVKQKLDCRTTADLVRYAVRNNLIYL